jgi:hypothetical protein
LRLATNIDESRKKNPPPPHSHPLSQYGYTSFFLGFFSEQLLSPLISRVTRPQWFC